VLSDRAIECSIEGCTDRYLELSGTSMAAPMVTSAVARMLQKDPTLSPATVKARLMRSARKIDDEPTAAGAGVLDIDAALDDTGVVPGEALSPVMVRDESTSNIFIEDTAELWGDALWAAGYLFNGGFTWAEGSGYIGDSTVSANGYLWTDGEVWAKGYLWTDGEEVWAKGYLWTDGEGVNAKSLLDGTDETGFLLNDDS
jgi:serine protease AprX